MNLQSHSIYDLREAQLNGEKIWEIDTDSDGQDDVLIGDYCEIIQDLCSIHGFDSIPDNWEITEITEPITEIFA